MRLIRAAACVLWVGAAVGCSEAPQEQMHAANAAIDLARAVQADLYARATFTAATDSFDVAVSQLQRQSARSALLRRYGKARNLFEQAAALGKRAADEAKANMAVEQQRLQGEVTAMVATAQAAIDSATALVEAVPVNRSNQPAIDALRSDLVALTSTLQEAQGELAAGNLESARARLDWIVRSSADMPDKLTAALSKAAQRRRG